MNTKKKELLSSPSVLLNCRKLVTHTAPIGVAGTLLGALALPAHAQQHSPIAFPHQGSPRNEFREITPRHSNFQIGGARLYTLAQGTTSDLPDITLNQPINDLGGSDIMVTTSMSTYHWFASDSLGAIYISRYSDANGDHYPDGSLGNALFIYGATGLTLTVHVRNSYLVGLLEIKYFS